MIFKNLAPCLKTEIIYHIYSYIINNSKLTYKQMLDIYLININHDISEKIKEKMILFINNEKYIDEEIQLLKDCKHKEISINNIYCNDCNMYFTSKNKLLKHNISVSHLNNIIQDLKSKYKKIEKELLTANELLHKRNMVCNKLSDHNNTLILINNNLRKDK